MENKIDTVNPSGNLIALLLKHPTAIYDLKINKTYFDEYIDKDNKVPNQNRAIFAMMEYLAETRDMDKLAFDPMTIGTLCYQDEAIRTVLNRVFKDKAETIKYLKSLKDFDVDIRNIDIYQHEIIKSKLTNELLEKNEQAVKDIVENYDKYSGEDIVNMLEDRILEVSNSFVDREEEPEHISKNIEEIYLNREVNEKGFIGMSSSFDYLDKFTGGFLRPGSLTIVNALPKVGKSIILKNIVLHVAITLGEPIYMGANEMTKEEQRDRIISEISGVAIKNVETGIYNKKGNEAMRHEIMKAIKILKNSKIHIDELRGATPEKLVRRAKFFKKRHGIKLFVWDYLDDSYGRGDEELRLFLTRLTTLLKQEGADKLKIPFLTASQAKTGDWLHTAETRGIEKKTTTMICLRDLTDKEKRTPLGDGATHGAFVSLNRHGEKHVSPNTEYVPLKLDKRTLRFKEMI